MFSSQIVNSDDFLEMPLTSQALYFHLGMSADDDGFVSPRKILRMTGAGEDDLKILLASAKKCAANGATPTDADTARAARSADHFPGILMEARLRRADFMKVAAAGGLD